MFKALESEKASLLHFSKLLLMMSKNLTAITSKPHYTNTFHEVDFAMKQHFIKHFSFFLLLTLGVVMSTEAANQPPPPCAEKEYRQFDFWIGEWEVFGPTGNKVGENKIERILGGCVLQESWTSTGVNRGHSFNIYDRSTGKWHQSWVDNGGTLLQLDGGLEGKSMVMSGETLGQNGKVLNRITWTPENNKAGKTNVKQVWDVSQDNGETWQTLFNGLYKRKSQ